MAEALNCFLGFKISFKEKRFVFEVPPAVGDKVEAVDPSKTKPTYKLDAATGTGEFTFYDEKSKSVKVLHYTPEKAAKKFVELGYNPDGTEKTPEVKATEEHEAKRDQLLDKSGATLDLLRSGLKPDQFRDLAIKLGLQSGPIFHDSFSADLDLSPGEGGGLSKLTEKLSLIVAAKMTDPKVVEEIHRILSKVFTDMTLDETKPFIANIYGSKMANEIKSEIEKGRYIDFLKLHPGYKINYSLDLEGYATYKFKPAFDNDAQKAEYDKWFTEQVKPADAQKPPEAEDPQRKLKVKAFAKSWLAKVMGFLGLLPMRKVTRNGKEVEEPDFDAVLKGEDPILVAAIGLCGGKHLLDNPAAYDDLVANLPDSQKNRVANFETRFKGSVVDLSNAGKAKPAEGKEGKEGELALFNGDKFKKWIDGTEAMPVNGFKLKNDVNVKDFKFDYLVLDLSEGELILPAKATFTLEVDGKQEPFPKPADEKAKTFKGSDLDGKHIVAIPSDTLLKGKVRPLPQKSSIPDSEKSS